MTELLTAAQMREIERAAIESGTVTGLELMERAGRGAVEAILAKWPELSEGDRRAVVLCGPGNNGGDGFVVARLLAERGWAVEVFLYGDAEKLPPDARANYERWAAIGEVVSLASISPLTTYGCDLAIDALFGIGLSRPLEGAAERAADDSTHNFGFFRNNPTVALDVPTGLCADSGKRLGYDGFVVCADLTIAFHSGKPGHYLDIGPDVSGKVVTVDIGLSSELSEAEGENSDAERVAPSFLVVPYDGLSEILLKREGHKYDHGHALVLSGGVGRGGAARMAARAALRVGAGLVTVGCPPAALIENAAQLNAIMLRAVKDGEALAEVLEDARVNALALGPGLGMTERTADLLRVVLKAKRPTVLDADALTMIAGDDDLRALVHDGCVLTPHAGEFARVFPAIAERLNATPNQGPAYSHVDAARDAAAAIGATVLLKGAATVIAQPDGRAAINAAVYDRAAPWLATAGAGDVLTGLIAGLLARGHTPFDAACTGAWLHTEAALKFGPGLIAEDLPDLIPRVLADLGA